jgi:outer membrane protein assembly factor BamD (BamD/ComL family)
MKIEEIERLAEQKYQEAELLLLQGDYAAAAEAFSSIVTTFPFTETAKKADVKLRILRTTPKAAAAVLYADAMAEISAENYPAAVKLLRQIVEKYPDEVAALKARTKLQEFEKSADVQAALKADSNLRADKVCPKWMSMAKNYVMNNQKDRAREYFLRVVAEFPQSAYADEAVKMLAEL